MITRVRALAALMVSTASFCGAQSAPARLGKEEIAALAKVQLAVSLIHDSLGAQLAMPRNKKPELQVQLREKLRQQVADVLHHNGMTDEEFRQKTYTVSTDPTSRKLFDSVMVVLTGAPLPGLYVAPTGGGRGSTPVPAGPAGIHIGHVINSFGDTPNNQGLLPVALTEARTAAQHAALATRQPTNLDYMKTHAGHVLNALDPALAATGPGLGYGLRKAAAAVTTHIELAAAAQGASPNIITHAKHVATSMRNTTARVDQLIVLAQKIQAATSATEAAALVSQMASLAEQLMAGADANADGKITWEQGEGGLQAADDHMKLMLAGER